MGTGGRRMDIDALRAVAVTAVVLFHAGVPGLAGGYVGVDVFFVISGFLITGLLLDEHQHRGRVAVGAFWARRARRILPGLVLTVAVVLPVAAAVQPTWDFAATVRSARAALCSAANLHFWDASQGYFAAGTARMPLLHLWSLGVEEQFYLALPLVVLACLRAGGRRAVGGALAVLAVASFAAAVAAVATDPRDAFFLPHLRAWELLAGSLLACARPAAARLPARAASALTGAGLAAIVVAVLRFDDRTAFPGLAALAPVAGTAAVIAAGVRTRSGAWAGRVAPNRLVQHLGRVSYAWYLWHWPALVLVREWGGGANLPRDLGVSAAALALASASTALVDDRFRGLGTTPAHVRRTLVAAATVLAVAIGTTTVVSAGVADRSEVAIPLHDVIAVADRHAVVATTAPPASDSTSTTTTTTWPADTDWSSDAAIHALADSRRLVDLPCSGPTAGLPLDPGCRLLPGSPVVAVVGDSHARQLVPAAIEIAVAHGWGVALASRPDCPVVPGVVIDLGPATYDGCTSWSDALMAQLTAPGAGVAMVLTSARSAFYLPGPAMAPGEFGEASVAGATDPAAAADAWAAGLGRLAGALQAAGIPMVWVQEVPDLPGWPSDCLARHSVTDCSADRRAFEQYRAPMWRAERAALGGRPGVAVVDPVDVLCAGQQCPPVRGTDVLYRDDNHLTLAGSVLLSPAVVAAAAGIG